MQPISVMELHNLMLHKLHNENELFIPQISDVVQNQRPRAPLFSDKGTAVVRLAT
jgi:hypothetical protein